ncbi:hypothetical protein N0V90_010983 [Kalmusia sp. IMI 367209]|nr:hypothetical protein N0V90_010983 [Kalmusia sp. IMI 367209]
MTTPSAIHLRVHDVGGVFVSLAQALSYSPQYADQIPRERIDDEFDRFKIWSGNISAHRKGRRSLEYRLRDASHLKDETNTLLTALERSLRHAVAIVQGQETPWDALPADDSDSDSDSSSNSDTSESEEDTELKQLLGSIKTSVTCLFRLSMAIRDPVPDSRVHGTITVDKSHFEEHDIQHARAKYPECAVYLSERLGRAISGRRQYLSYREQHHQKLAKNVELIGIEQARTEHTTNSTEATPIPTARTNSFDVFDDDSLSQTSYATSVNATIRVPSLPKEAREQSHFECPLCFMIVSIHTTAAWNEFKSHVIKRHPELSSPAMFSALKRTARRGADIAAQANCPFCDERMTVRALQRHVGRHQEQLALFALPPNLEGTEDNARDENSDSTGAAIDIDQWQDEEISDLSDVEDPNGMANKKSSLKSRDSERDSLDLAERISKGEDAQQLGDRSPSGRSTDSEPNNLDQAELISSDEDYQSTIPTGEDVHGKAVVLYDFEGENHNELSVLEGQIIFISYRHVQGWLVAQDPKTGESGLVPEEYIRLLRDIEGGWDPPPDKEVGDAVKSSSDKTEEEDRQGKMESNALYKTKHMAAASASESQDPSITSYWSSSEQNNLKDLIPIFGTDWQAIADRMMTKTPTMVKDQCLQLIASGQAPELEEFVKKANPKLDLENPTTSPDIIFGRAEKEDEKAEDTKISPPEKSPVEQQQAYIKKDVAIEEATIKAAQARQKEYEESLEKTKQLIDEERLERAAAAVREAEKAEAESKRQEKKLGKLEQLILTQQDEQLNREAAAARAAKANQERDEEKLREELESAAVHLEITDKPRLRPITGPGPSSYWSVTEQADFLRYVSHFGTNWAAIATHMRTKTQTMVKNQYLRLVESGQVDLERAANAADERRTRGDDLGPPPMPTPAQKRRYENTQVTVSAESIQGLAKGKAKAEILTDDIISKDIAIEKDDRERYVQTQSMLDQEQDEDEDEEGRSVVNPHTIHNWDQYDKSPRRSNEDSAYEEVRPFPRADEDDISFVLEYLDSEPGYDSDIEVVRPDHFEYAKSDRSGSRLDNNAIIDQIKDFQLEKSSSDEEEIRQRIHRKTRKRRVDEEDSDYSDNDPLDDIDASARRLRRRVRGSNHRTSLIFEDSPYANLITEMEEPEDGGIDHTQGPPSIPSDDAPTLDKLPFYNAEE